MLDKQSKSMQQHERGLRSDVLKTQSTLADAGSFQASRLGLPRFSWSLTLLGLCVFTFVIVTFKIRIAEVGIAIAALGLLFQLGKLRVPFPVWTYGAYILWAFISSYASEYQEIAQTQNIEQLKLLFIMLITVNALQTNGQIRFYLMFFLACYILFPVRGTLINYFVVGYHPFGRAIWNYIYNNPNDLASLTLFALGISMSLATTAPRRSLVQIGSGVSAFLMLVVILLTESRGAFLGLAVGMGPAFFRIGMKRPRILVLMAVVGIAIAMVIPSSVWVRLSGIEKLTSVSTVGEADPEGSAAQRFEIQKVGFQIFLDHPVFGVGLGTYPIANAQYSFELGKRDTHNTYLNIAAEIGLPGLVLWLLCFGAMLRYSIRRRRSASILQAQQQVWIERALVAYLVAALFGTYSALTFPYLVLAILWCMASQQQEPAKNITNTTNMAKV